MEKGVPIRSVSRSIAVLQCINGRGSLTMTEIARLVKLPYPTIFRIMQTLQHEGLVESEPSRKRYRATCKVQSLASGYHEVGRLVDTAAPALVELTRHVGWPVTLTTAVGTTVVIRDCTHEMSALTFSRYYPGDTFPMLACAPGHVHLAFSDEATRECLLKGLENQHGRSTTLELFKNGTLTRRVREDGYATYDRTQHTKDPGKTSSISVPLPRGDGTLAHLTLNFFVSAMPMREAVTRFLDDLRTTAGTVAQQLAGSAAAEMPEDDDLAPPLPAPRRSEAVGHRPTLAA